MNPETPNDTTFRRVRKKLRQHCDEKKQLLARIRQLEGVVAEENRKARDLHTRLHRLLDADVFADRGPQQTIRMCVNVDARLASLSHGNVVYDEAIRQLVEGLRQALRSR